MHVIRIPARQLKDYFHPLEGYITSSRISDTIIHSQRTGRLARTETIARKEEKKGTRGQIRAFDRNLDFVPAIEG